MLTQVGMVEETQVAAAASSCSILVSAASRLVFIKLTRVTANHLPLRSRKLNRLFSTQPKVSFHCMCGHTQSTFLFILGFLDLQKRYFCKAI